jgi:hypothetical protein
MRWPASKRVSNSRPPDDDPRLALHRKSEPPNLLHDDLGDGCSLIRRAANPFHA